MHAVYITSDPAAAPLRRRLRGAEPGTNQKLVFDTKTVAPPMMTSVHFETVRCLRPRRFLIWWTSPPPSHGCTYVGSHDSCWWLLTFQTPSYFGPSPFSSSTKSIFRSIVQDIFHLAFPPLQHSVNGSQALAAIELLCWITIDLELATKTTFASPRYVYVKASNHNIHLQQDRLPEHSKP